VEDVRRGRRTQHAGARALPGCSLTPTPVFIYSDTAQYYLVQAIYGTATTFPVDFDNENGAWKIREF